MLQICQLVAETKVAQVMVDLVLEGRDSIPDDFRVSAL